MGNLCPGDRVDPLEGLEGLGVDVSGPRYAEDSMDPYERWKEEGNFRGFRTRRAEFNVFYNDQPIEDGYEMIVDAQQRRGNRDDQRREDIHHDIEIKLRQALKLWRRVKSDHVKAHQDRE